MSPEWTFVFGMVLLALFGWYFATDSGRRKMILGSALTVLVLAFCLESLYPPQQKIRLGLDLRGGTSFLISLKRENNRQLAPGLLDQAVEVIRKRVDRFGVGEPVITPQGDDRILVQIPGLDPAQIAEARGQLQKVAKLEFRLVHPQSSRLVPMIEAGEELIPPGYAVESVEGERKEGEPTRKLLVSKKAALLGDRVTAANSGFGPQGYEVSLEFDSKGADEFATLTKQVGREDSAMAIVLDGKVMSAPTVDGSKYPAGIVGGRAQISGGSMGEKEARNLASALENPLQTPVAVEDERSVSSTLGADSIRSGVISGVVGLALTLLFVMIYYRFAGLVANIALLINIVVLFGAMAMFNFVLTLPGIAGIILTIGMAIDANVLIYERLREEMAAGKSLGAALSAAYDKAFSAIFDSNVTTLITAVILFWKATGPVKGFAVTLMIGILASMFTALIVTKNCFGWALQTGFLKNISMWNLIRATNYDFLGKRRLALGISSAIIAGSILLMAVRGERNFGVDFKGGDLLVLEAQKEKIPEGEVRKALEAIQLADSVVQTERSAESEYLTIRSSPQTSEKIQAHLFATFPQAQFRVEQSDKVGKLVGNELARNSLVALALGLIGILIYVTLRFEFSFALGALVALLHDVIITIGAFALFDRQLSLIIVGAVLTIAGYSINDTIVVFDRIREGIRSGRKGSTEVIMNQSINETLSRTLLTGGTTLFTTAALYFLGGPVLNDFAFAILIGVIVGTYSSVFVAAPIVLWWAGRKGGNLQREVREAEVVATQV